MAKPEILFIDESKNEVTFTLSNKPNYVCLMDLDKFNDLVLGSNSYFIKEFYSGKMAYISRSIYNKGKSSTGFLHWDVTGERHLKDSGFVTDHINRNTLDNRSLNLRKATYRENTKNRDILPYGKILEDLEIEMPDGYCLSKFERGGNFYYQAYYRRSYVKSSKFIKVVIDAIEEHQKTKGNVQ